MAELDEIAEELPPLPEKVYKPQQRGNIGPGKLYADEAAFRAAVDEYERQKAARKMLMAEREKKQKQTREQHRDRSGRQQVQPSGAAKRKRAGMTAAEKAGRNRENNRTRYWQYIARLRAACPPRMLAAGVERRRREEELLGDGFVVDGQRVRVVSTGACGTVVERAQLCVEQDGQVVQEPEQDGSGALVLPLPEQQHRIHLDGQGEERISPLDVTPWPHLGQSVRWFDETNEVATVIELPHNRYYESDGLQQNVIVLSRTTYAAREDVQRYTGGSDLQIGDWARLLPPHPEAQLCPEADERTANLVLNYFLGPDGSRHPEETRWEITRGRRNSVEHANVNLVEASPL